MPAELIAVAGTTAGLLLFWTAARWQRRLRTARSRRLGARAERHAERLLRAAGYRVVDTQPTATVTVEVDGEPHSYTVRGDLIVRRRRRRYLAEIKGGPDVSSVQHRGTRRQLLEYACAFDVDGVLLVDMHRREVRKVRFPALY